MLCNLWLYRYIKKNDPVHVNGAYKYACHYTLDHFALILKMFYFHPYWWENQVEVDHFGLLGAKCASNSEVDLHIQSSSAIQSKSNNICTNSSPIYCGTPVLHVWLFSNIKLSLLHIDVFPTKIVFQRVYIMM